MKKKRLILFAGILLVLVYSCRKNFMPEMEVKTAATGKFSIIAARDHIKALVRGDVAYDGKLPAKIMGANGTTTQSAAQQKTIKTGQKIFYPFWNKAITATYKGKVEYIEVPIAISKRQIRLYQFKQDNIKEKPDASVANSAFQRLIIYKDKNGQIGQRLLTYIPDKQYIREHGNSAGTNSLQRLQPNFFWVYRI